MDSVPTWVLMDTRFRWVYLTPQVVSSRAEEGRLSHVHRLHISLTAQSPSIPICGKYQPGEYHPYPLVKTRAVAQDDACVDCVRTLQKVAPAAIGLANRMLYIQGSVLDIPTEPSPPLIPPEIVAQLGQVAALTLHMQNALGPLRDWLAQSGVHLPEALQQFGIPPPLLAPPERLEKLPTYERFREWCRKHPDGLVAIPRPPTKLRIHYVWCRHVKDQLPHTFVGASGALNASDILAEYEREPAWCGDCLGGHAPNEDT